MKPRKHAELIKAWADGATIQRFWNGTHGKAWLIDNEPDWNEFDEYRIKPEPIPDVVQDYHCKLDEDGYIVMNYVNPKHLKLTFDGETGELKSAEVIKASRGEE